MGLLDVHRHQVPVEHRGGLHEVLAERHHRELDRQPAGEQHAPFDRRRHGLEVQVAAHELGPAVADPDHGSTAHRGVAEAFGPQDEPADPSWSNHVLLRGLFVMPILG
jgi:hypothetical protein